MPERKGTAMAWKSSSSEPDASAIIGGAEEEEAGRIAGAFEDDVEGTGSAAGRDGAEGSPRACWTCESKAGIWKKKKK